MPKQYRTTLSPAQYAESAVLAAEVHEQMLLQLEWITLQPNVIVDMGCGVGLHEAGLKKRFPDAAIIAVDYAENMLKVGHQQHQDVTWVCAEVERIPLQNHTVDLIFANLVLPWCGDINAVLTEWRRILKPEGLLIFSSLGPDTLIEMREGLLPDLTDMHNLGDALVQARFTDPVLNTDYLTVTYREPAAMMQDLQHTGMISADFTEFTLERNEAGVIPLTYEIIYGHAWRPDFMADQVTDEFGVVKIPLAHLRRK